jgi:YggT family protein
VNALLTGFDAALVVARMGFLALAVVVTAVCGIDWAVRTRRVSPFSPVARFFRNSIDPLMAPIERRIVRSGGVPSNAPWWALGAVVVGGILVLWLIGFIRSFVLSVSVAAAGGPRSFVRLAVEWLFIALQLALLVRVLSSWIRVSPYSRWVRWAFVLTEPIIRPLRRFIPPIGGTIDVTPIAAYFVIWLVSGLVLRML